MATLATSVQSYWKLQPGNGEEGKGVGEGRKGGKKGRATSLESKK